MQRRDEAVWFDAEGLYESSGCSDLRCFCSKLYSGLLLGLRVHLWSSKGPVPAHSHSGEYALEHVQEIGSPVLQSGVHTQSETRRRGTNLG